MKLIFLVPMKRALAIFLLAAWITASAQNAKLPEYASAIAGTIVGEPDSHPLKKVIVQVMAEDQKQGGNYSSVTDVDGHFRVDNVVPGRYRVFLEKTGFIEVNNRGQKAEVNMVTVPPGQSVEEVMLRMLPASVITGRITDEDGDPMSAVRVVALKRVPGKAKRETVSVAATDDLGEYRLAETNNSEATRRVAARTKLPSLPPTLRSLRCPRKNTARSPNVSGWAPPTSTDDSRFAVSLPAAICSLPGRVSTKNSTATPIS